MKLTCSLTESVKVADVAEVHHPATEVGGHLGAAPVALVLHELLRRDENARGRGYTLRRTVCFLVGWGGWEVRQYEQLQAAAVSVS